MVHKPLDEGTTLSADEALARLKEGNARFLAGEARFPTVQKEVLAELSRGQKPFATILGCSDSRVPPELLFDASFGQLFVVRVAGNVLGPAIFGTLQYAGIHLRTPLFVVLGHQGCGAVEAAMQEKFSGAVHASRIRRLLDEIRPGLDKPDPALSHEAQLEAAVEQNVRYTLQGILKTAEGRARVAEGRMKAVGAVFEMSTGEVRFLD